MNHITLIESLLQAGSVKSIKNALRQVDVQTANSAVIAVIEELEDVIEININNHEDKLAVWNLSKLSFLEDYKMQLERSLYDIKSLQVAGM